VVLSSEQIRMSGLVKALRGYGAKGAQQAGLGGYSTGSGYSTGRDSGQGLCSTGCPASDRWEFWRWQQKHWLSRLNDFI